LAQNIHEYNGGCDGGEMERWTYLIAHHQQANGCPTESAYTPNAMKGSKNGSFIDFLQLYTLGIH
jgi:hypothetical protein